MNRAPAFQFYVDVWTSHTKHLSDGAYTIYHRLLCWMWEHAADYCSIPADHEQIAFALGRRLEEIEAAMGEIMNPVMPLLLLEKGRLVSKRLRQERESQIERSKHAQHAAMSRHGKRLAAVLNQCPDDAQTMPDSCTLSPSLSPSLDSNKKENTEAKLLALGEFKNVKLSEQEHAKLLKVHGKTRLDTGIEILGDYMAANGKRYKSHYAVLKKDSWVWTRVDEKQPRQAPAETDRTILEYAKQWKRMKQSGVIFDNDKSDFFKKVRDNCGPDGVKRVMEAAKG